MFSGGSHRHSLLESKLGQGAQWRTEILLGRTKPFLLEWLSWKGPRSTGLQEVPGSFAPQSNVKFEDSTPANSVPVPRTKSGFVMPEGNSCVPGAPPWCQGTMGKATSQRLTGPVTPGFGEALHCPHCPQPQSVPQI